MSSKQLYNFGMSIPKAEAAAYAACRRESAAEAGKPGVPDLQVFSASGYLLDQQLQLILASLTYDNRLVLQTMLRTGLRVSDVLTLPKAQLGRCFWVTESKTGKRLQCGLPDWLAGQIRARAGGSFWAFPSPADPTKHRSRQAVWADIKRAQRAFRLPVNCGTHSARKVYAVKLMEKYGDIEKVRRALNHGSATTTVIYAMADMLTASAYSRRLQYKRRR